MEFIKYFTNPTFDNKAFANMLRLKMNVRAKAVEDGVILDREAFNATSAALMPNWAWMNKKSINSNLHTRPAEPAEWPDLTCKYKYVLVMLTEDNMDCPLEQADDRDYISMQADMVASFFEDKPNFIGVAVVDNNTGEVVHLAK